MEIETLKAMNEDLQVHLMMMIEIVVLITVLLAIAGIAIYLAGIAWYWLRGNETEHTCATKSTTDIVAEYLEVSATRF